MQIYYDAYDGLTPVFCSWYRLQLSARAGQNKLDDGRCQKQSLCNLKHSFRRAVCLPKLDVHLRQEKFFTNIVAGNINITTLR